MGSTGIKGEDQKIKEKVVGYQLTGMGPFFKCDFLSDSEVYLLHPSLISLRLQHKVSLLLSPYILINIPLWITCL